MESILYAQTQTAFFAKNSRGLALASPQTRPRITIDAGLSTVAPNKCTFQHALSLDPFSMRLRSRFVELKDQRAALPLTATFLPAFVLMGMLQTCFMTVAARTISFQSPRTWSLLESYWKARNTNSNSMLSIRRTRRTRDLMFAFAILFD